MSDLNHETARVLKSGTLLGLCIMAIGLLLSAFDFGELIISIGIVILIFTPMVGVLVSTKCMIQEKDTYWTRIAILLIVIVVIGAVISYFT